MIIAFIGSIFIGWLLGDFISGLFHWWEDRIGNPNTPIIGKWIIIPNRLHHEKPMVFIDEGSFMVRNRALVLAALLVGIPTMMLIGFSPLILAAMIGGGFANEIHAWAHRPSMAPKWAKVLQEIGLIQSPRHHKEHHRPPQDKNYCIVTDWLNPILEAIKFFPTLEKLFRR